MSLLDLDDDMIRPMPTPHPLTPQKNKNIFYFYTYIILFSYLYKYIALQFMDFFIWAFLKPNSVRFRPGLHTIM